MQTRKLTEKKVAAILARPAEGRSSHADGAGLTLITYPDKDGRTRGAYVLQARTALTGDPLRIGLGSAISTSLAKARAEAIRLRAVIAAGGNPVAQKREARADAQAAEASTVGKYLENVYGPAMVKANRKAASASQARIKAAWKPLMDTPLAQVTEAMIEKVIEKRKGLEDEDEEQLLSNATLRRDWSTFRPLLVMAYETRIIPTLPIIGIPKPLRGLTEEPSKRYLGKDDPDERRRFFEALDAFDSAEPGGGDFLRVVCLLAVNAGLRRGEILALRDDMLPLNVKGEERVELPAGICKANKERTVYLNVETVKAIRRWQAVRKALKVEGMAGELFPGKADWSGRITRREFPRLCTEAKIEGLVFKSLRCTFASLHVQRGTPLQTVQQMLGHSSVTITERHYAYLRKDAGRKQAQAFNARKV